MWNQLTQIMSELTDEADQKASDAAESCAMLTVEYMAPAVGHQSVFVEQQFRPMVGDYVWTVPEEWRDIAERWKVNRVSYNLNSEGDLVARIEPA